MACHHHLHQRQHQKQQQLQEEHSINRYFPFQKFKKLKSSRESQTIPGNKMFHKSKTMQESLSKATTIKTTLTLALVLLITAVIPSSPVSGNDEHNFDGFNLMNKIVDANGIVATKYDEASIEGNVGVSNSNSNDDNNNNNSNNNNNNNGNIVLINKCCAKFEIHVDNDCSQVDESEYFKPIITQAPDSNVKNIKYKFVVGIPACGSMQIWPIYDNTEGSDKLIILEDGRLRHYTNSKDDYEEQKNGRQTDYVDQIADYDETDEESRYHDYEHGKYCIDKAVSSTGPNAKRTALYAKVCFAKKENKWTDANFLVLKVLNTIFHVIALIILLVIAIVYFVLPTLRDLVGNIVTSIALCLMVSQVADLVRLFTEFTNHVSFMVADIILYFSLLGAFLWLNSFGYYIWKTFRSRNVFLRVTDGRKYCYYSVYVWCTTAFMAGLAIFAHFFLDAESYKKENLIADQETIGWLGVAVFFAPIACSIIVDIFFYVTTLKLINRRNVYGRIQHKLKANFIMFSLMLLVMSLCWVFFILTWLRFDGLLYTYTVINAVQSPLLLYICVLRQNNVKFLLKKSCCYNEPPSVNDWGDEMYYMNSNNYDY